MLKKSNKNKIIIYKIGKYLYDHYDYIKVKEY